METVTNCIKDALLDLVVTPMGGAVAAKQTEHALRQLNRIVKSWQLLDDAPDFLRTSQTLTLTTAASYTLTVERPVRILNANLRRSGIDLPMWRMNRQDYDELPNKATTGTPTQYYYDRQKQDALFYVWPVLATAAGETVVITYEREFAELEIGDALDLPPEWYDVAVRQLTVRLAPAYGKESALQALQGLADRALNRALGAGMSNESVMFHG